MVAHTYSPIMCIIIIKYCLLSEQRVFAKREIPLQMKFGPFVGESKTLNKHEIKLYRESNPNYPLLFLSQNSILDVSNESKLTIAITCN